MAYCIVDGNYQVCRCVYSTGSDLKSASGLQTGGVYKFLKVLWTIRELGDPIVVFDGGHSKRRKELLPEYKERAESLNEELTEDEIKTKELFQYTFDTLEKLLPRMGIPVVKLPGAEGDDVMYRITEYLRKAGNEVYVATDDSDMLQFVALGARIFRPMKNEFVTPANFVERMGFEPQFFALWKAIIGDKSDNIGGVYGAGPVKATKIITEIAPKLNPSHSCDDDTQVLLEWSKDNQKSKLGQSIKDNIDIIRRNIFLIDLRYNDLSSVEVVNEYRRSNHSAKIDIGHVVSYFKEADIVTLSSWITYLVKKSKTAE